MNTMPLILVPGLLCDDALWEHQAEFLSQAADVIITDKHMHYETIERIAEAILADAPSRFALAGLSMGGYIALEICRKSAERVQRLALIDTSARADTPEQTERRKKLMDLCRQGTLADVNELLFPALVHPDRLNDKELKRRIEDMSNRVGADNFIRQQNAIINRPNQVPYLPEITCPTIIVCGERDQITPLTCAEEMASSIKGSRLETIPHCGHISTMEKPEEVSKILLDWLRGRN